METLTWFTFWSFWYIWKALERKTQAYALVFRMEKCGVVDLSVFLPVENRPGGQGGPGVPTAG